MTKLWSNSVKRERGKLVFALGFFFKGGPDFFHSFFPLKALFILKAQPIVQH